MTTPAEQPAEQPVVCPECGSGLRFERDRTGYGRTIEMCEHFDARVGRGCKHWRPLEIVRHPAHTPVPPGPKPRPAGAPRTPKATGYRMKTRVQMHHLRAVLPTSKDAALTVEEIAARTKFGRLLAERLLRLMYADGELGRRTMPRPARYGRPFMGYWLLTTPRQEAA